MTPTHRATREQLIADAQKADALGLHDMADRRRVLAAALDAEVEPHPT